MDLTLTDQNFAEEIKKATVPILVDFWAAWCAPCRLVAPILKEIGQEMDGRLVIGKLDVDANPQTAMKFSVLSIPTLIIFKSGQPVKQLVGYQDKVSLLKTINELL